VLNIAKLSYAIIGRYICKSSELCHIVQSYGGATEENLAHPFHKTCRRFQDIVAFSAVDSGGAGGAKAPPEFVGSEKGQSLTSAYQSLSIATNTPGFKKLSTALALADPCLKTCLRFQDNWDND
jgi:hypothetical protein